MAKNMKRNTPYIMISIILGIAAAVAIFLFFCLTRGEVKTFGEAKDAEPSESVTCTTDNLLYPFFTYDNADNKKTTAIMTFDGNDLTSIYLAQEMYYTTSSLTSTSATINHASMNKAFNADYGADAFNANYYASDDMMRMTLYTKSDKLTEDAKKFFLIDSSSLTKNVLIKNYETQDFVCNNN